MSWLVTARCDIYTFADCGTVVDGGAGGPATKCRSAGPYEAAVDDADLLIADLSSHRVRMATG